MSIANKLFCRRKIVSGVAAALLMNVSAIAVSEDSRIDMDIKAQGAGSAMVRLAEYAGVQITVPSEVGDSIRLTSIKGEYTLTEALDRMLSDTGLSYRFTSDQTIVIETDESVESEGNGEEVDEEVVVTGSRLKGKHPVASPVTTFTREDIERGGYTSLQDVFRRLSQNLSSINSQSVDLFQSPASADRNAIPLSGLGASSVDLRGLGAGSTLILVNGRRKARSANGNGGFVDMSSIPLSQVERIEVLHDGASAIYGADAVAGVVNIVLRKNYEGAELNVRHEDSGSGANLTRVTGTYGFSWDTGQLNASIDLSDSKSADTARFVHAGPDGPGDFTHLNGVNWREVGYDAVNPAVYSTVSLLGFDTSYDSTSPLQEGSGGSVFDLPNIGPATEQNTVRLFGDQELGGSLKLDFDASYSKQEDQRTWHPWLWGGFSRLQLTRSVMDISGRPDPLPRNQLLRYGSLIPATNPNNPYGEDVLVGYSWARELALLDPLSEENEQEDISFSLALTGEVAFLDGWDFELSYAYSDSEGMQEPAAFYSIRKISLPDEIENQILDFWDTVNIFTDDPADAAANAAMLNNLVDDASFSDYDSNAHSLDFVMRTGSLFSLPAGDVAASMGVHYRDEDIYQRDVVSAGLSTFEQLPTDNSTKTKAVFFETNLPLLSNIPFVQSLSLNLAARYEEVDGRGLSQLEYGAGNRVGDFGTGDKLLYSLPGIDIEGLTGFAPPPEGTVIVGEGNFGTYLSPAAYLSRSYSATTPSVKLNWQVNDDLRLRATWGESFQAPLAASQFGQTTISSGSYFQFVFSGGIFPDGLPPFPALDVVSMLGANPNLIEQTADTLTYGFDYTPSWLEGLSLQASYIRQTYDNYIFTIPFFGNEFLPVGQNVEDYPDIFQFTTGAGGTGVVQDVMFWNTRAGNVAKRFSEAVDIDVRYSMDTDIGLWSTRLAATRTFEVFNQFDERITPLVFSDSERGPGKWKGNLELSWTGEEYSATVFVNYEDDARVLDPASQSAFSTSAFSLGLTDEVQSKSGSYTTIDLQVAYAPQISGWMEGLKVSLGAQNLFKPDLPFVDNRAGYVASKVNARSRVVYLDVRKSFDF